MSLIVGHAAPDIGFLVADTLLSFPNELGGRLVLAIRKVVSARR